MDWHTLGEFTKVSNDESKTANQLCTVLDRGDAEILSVSTFGQGRCVTDTTVMVVERPDERLLFVLRQDGSMVVATTRSDTEEGWYLS